MAKKSASYLPCKNFAMGKCISSESIQKRNLSVVFSSQIHSKLRFYKQTII